MQHYLQSTGGALHSARHVFPDFLHWDLEGEGVHLVHDLISKNGLVSPAIPPLTYVRAPCSDLSEKCNRLQNN